MRDRILKYLSGVLLAISFVSLPFIVFGDNGLGRVERLEKQVDEIRRENSEIEWEIEELGRQIRHMRDTPQIIKQIAREELGYVTQNEVVFIVP